MRGNRCRSRTRCCRPRPGCRGAWPTPGVPSVNFARHGHQTGQPRFRLGRGQVDDLEPRRIILMIGDELRECGQHVADRGCRGKVASTRDICTSSAAVLLFYRVSDDAACRGPRFARARGSPLAGASESRSRQPQSFAPRPAARLSATLKNTGSATPQFRTAIPLNRQSGGMRCPILPPLASRRGF